MKINRTVEKPDGSVTFQGNLEGPELDFVIEVGLNVLMEQGALPFAHKKSVSTAQFMEAPEQSQ